AHPPSPSTPSPYTTLFRSLVGPNLRRSLNHGREVLQHFGIVVAAIGVRVFFPIPQTDGDGVLAVWIEERELVCEAGLFPKSRQRSEEHTSELQSRVELVCS